MLFPRNGLSPAALSPGGRTAGPITLLLFAVFQGREHGHSLFFLSAVCGGVRSAGGDWGVGEGMGIRKVKTVAAEEHLRVSRPGKKKSEMVMERSPVMT